MTIYIPYAGWVMPLIVSLLGFIYVIVIQFTYKPSSQFDIGPVGSYFIFLGSQFSAIGMLVGHYLL